MGFFSKTLKYNIMFRVFGRVKNEITSLHIIIALDILTQFYYNLQAHNIIALEHILLRSFDILRTLT